MMTHDLSFEKNLNQARELFDSRQPLSKIESELFKNGLDIVSVQAIMNQLKNDRYERKRKRGLKRAGWGALLLFAGFVLTVCLFHQNASIDLAMYGITSIGIVLLFAGMVDILG